MFWVFIGQWVLGVAFALFWSPYTWIGDFYEIHVHVWAAVVVGGSISLCAIFWMRWFPAESHTRHAVAICQVLYSALLIHLSGGRIETHFHVFASLAILSIYKDWKILVTATAVVAIDHFYRGVFYPASVFGIFVESPYRWMEHAAWVLFEFSFLAPGCYRLKNAIVELCDRQIEIEEAKLSVDRLVAERTQELELANKLLAEKTVESEKLALVARHTDNGVVITDVDSNVEWVNSSYSSITGYSFDEVVGKRHVDYLLGNGKDQNSDDLIQHAFENKAGFNTEIINYRKNGEPFWLAMDVRPIVDEAGNVERFIAVHSDVTIRKEMELSLAAAEARLRSIINNIPGVFYRKEIDAHGNVRFQFVSDAISELTGIPAGSFASVATSGFVGLAHEDDRDALKKKIQEAIQSNSRLEHQYRLVDNEGNIKWVTEIGQLSSENEVESSKRYIDGVLFDITERVEAENENRKLQAELLDASRQAGMAEVATGVLHNVGNILNSVNVSANVIQSIFSNTGLNSLEKLNGLLSQHESSFESFVTQDKRGGKIPDFINKVTSALRYERNRVDGEFNELLMNVEHINEIINVQQSVAKMGGVKQEIDARELVHSALSVNKPAMEKSHIRFESQIDDSVPAFVSDKHRVLQILINLIKNAKDALEEHNVEDPQIDVRVTTENDRVVFSVSDNGIGIANENLDQIFRHGFTTKANGHGFGLHSCANAATELGGNLSVSSEGLGKGAQFKLQIPIEILESPVTADHSAAGKA